MKEELYSQLPNEVKNLLRKAREGAEKDKETPLASTRNVNKAETTIVQAQKQSLRPFLRQL